MSTARVNITDRAKRYRAQNAVTGPRKCVLCGSKSDLGVMHLDGNESHGEPANLAYGCRSCNGKLAAAFKRIGAGRPTNQYNPSQGVPTFAQYAWAVSNHSRGEHDEGGAVIHATPKHKRIEYARRIAAGKSATMRERDLERWNPPASPHAVGWAAAKLGRNRAEALQEYLESVADRNLNAKQRQVLVTMFNEGYKGGARHKSNPWPFSRPDARRTTPAHGGIAYHQGKSRKRADDKNAEFLKSSAQKHAKAITFKGRAIKPTEGGAWVVPSIDKESEFDTLQDAKAFVTSWKRNPAVASAEVFEEFHGYAPSEVVTVTKHIHHHEHLAAAGKLTHLDVWGVDDTGHKISGFKGAFLAFNETKNQLFVEGGDQSIDLADFGIDSPHELETLGRLTDIGYQTNKTHLGDEGGEAVYVHKFRTTNDKGKHVVVKIARYPDLIYDVRNEQLLFAGGSYEILREGIDK